MTGLLMLFVEQLMAAAGCVYLSGNTAGLITGYFALRSLGETGFKGIEKPVALFELAGIGSVSQNLRRRAAQGYEGFVIA